MGVTGILDTGKQALIAQQTALQVVGQNIGNVNTPGYTRERPVMIPIQSDFRRGNLSGGVTVDHIQRVFDQFITAQLHVATASFQATQEQTDQLARLEVLFNDLSQGDGALSSHLERFFQGFQDLANNPQGLPERTGIKEQGDLIANAFHELDSGLVGLNRDLNQALSDELSGINRLTGEIADLNMKIQQLETDPKNVANTFRDQRDELVRQLSEKIAVTSFETNEGDVTVLIGGARPLIESGRANSLMTITNTDNPENLLVRMQDPNGNVTDVSRNITGGKIQGILAVRDTLLPRFASRLDHLAAQLTRSVNQVHSNGYGLDGSTGNNFFVPRQASAQTAAGNTGGGTVQSVSVFDPTQLTLDDYSLTFTANGPPPTFDIVNATTGETLATGQTYTSGAAIRFAGIEVAIADGSAAPQVGDTFSINSTKDAAKLIAVDTSILSTPQKIAAGATPQAGDNTNALSISSLRDTKVMDGNTFTEFYGSLVSSVGLEKQNSSLMAEQRQLVVTQVENRRESKSGVSLDEEQLDLIRFQQAFAAAANFIRIASEMADTIVGLVQ